MPQNVPKTESQPDKVSIIRSSTITLTPPGDAAVSLEFRGFIHPLLGPPGPPGPGPNVWARIQRLAVVARLGKRPNSSDLGIWGILGFWGVLGIFGGILGASSGWRWSHSSGNAPTPPIWRKWGAGGAQQERETRPLRRPRPERLFGAPERGNRYLVQVEGHLNASGGLSSELTLTWDRTGVPGGSEISFFFLEPFRGSPGGCPSRPSCLSCLADLGCAWCPPSSSCHPRDPPPKAGAPCAAFGADSGDFGAPRLVLHPQNCVLCEEHRDCRSCAGDPFCEWQTLGPPDSKRGDFVCSRRGRQGGAVRDPRQCPPPCSQRSTCSECLAPPSQCAWCPSARRCFLFASYLARYPFGGCRGWSDSVHSAPQCRGCSELTSCRECLSQHGCGWCGRGHNPALGSCFEGDFSGPHHFPNCSVALGALPVPDGGHEGDHEGGHKGDHKGDHEGGHKGDQEGGHKDDHEGDHKGAPEVGYKGDPEGGHKGDPEGGHKAAPEVAPAVPSWSYGSCPDVDECQLGLARCHPRARCHNSPGSFECRCQRGFRGDGVSACEPTCLSDCGHGSCSGPPQLHLHLPAGLDQPPTPKIPPRGGPWSPPLPPSAPWTAAATSTAAPARGGARGSATRCQNWTEGPRCQRCRPGSFGPGGFGGCRPCRCHGHGDPERGFCHRATGQCHCRPPTTGAHCDRCAPGYYGDPSAQQGPHCDRCAPGYYGDPRPGGAASAPRVLGVPTAPPPLGPGSIVWEPLVADTPEDGSFVYAFDGVPALLDGGGVQGDPTLIGALCGGGPSTASAWRPSQGFFLG
ncbi:multiple epidermal growth factor-like domains protein 8 [Aphelocoma coerulescens]|uniref:multiple epidermal growth factor-like domains protein 8 n=1 Tax=Aphelocoma coerulescens TaxID=39617 RepID=UPI003604F663